MRSAGASPGNGPASGYRVGAGVGVGLAFAFALADMALSPIRFCHCHRLRPCRRLRHCRRPRPAADSDSDATSDLAPIFTRSKRLVFQIRGEP